MKMLRAKNLQRILIISLVILNVNCLDDNDGFIFPEEPPAYEKV